MKFNLKPFFLIPQNSISPGVLSVLNENQKADRALYSHFLAKHKADLNKFGLARMSAFEAQLQQLNRYVVRKCRIKAHSDGRTAQHRVGSVT